MSNQKSARTLLWLSLILLLVGSTIGDPTASLAILVLAAISALVTVILGGKWSKLLGVIVLIVTLFLGQAFWSSGKNHQNQYLERARKAAAESSNALKQN